jgi:hypothetical protein
MQASRFECLSFDPFTLLQNGFVSSEVDVGRCDVVDALVIALVVVVVDEGFDLGLEIARHEVVFQQNAVLQGLVPALDLALRLGKIWRATGALHAFVLQPFGKIASDIAGSIIAKQARFVDDVNLIAT